MTKVAVVILNFNGKNFLQQFLPSLVNYSEGASIVVADNGSTDGSADFVRKELPGVKVISISENRGFCGGYNTVLKQVEAKYYVLVNSDIEVTRNWLTPILELMENDSSIAAAQPKILAQRAKHKFEYAGAAGGKIDTLAYPFCRGRIFDSIEEDKNQYDDVVEIFWATGACLFVRADRYHEMGGLDEDFFAHMEEIDLCWKLRRAGHKIFYHGKSTVFHVGGGTLSASNPRKTYFNFRNGLSLLVKHQPISSLLWKFPLRLFLDWVAAFHFLLNGSGVHGKAIIIAHLSFLRRFGHEMKKRSETERNIRNFSVPNIYRGFIVFDYFLSGKKNYKDLKV